METTKLRETMDVIITNTFNRLETVYNNHKEGFNSKLPLPTGNESRLVFPAYYKKGEKKDTRISEQELRFAFIEEFNYYCKENGIDLFYSVETPTKEAYSGFTTNPQPDPNGRSGEFDTVILDKDLKRVCLIEFKANNAGPIDHKKDFLKLDYDEKDNEDVLRYFIEIVKSYRNATINSLKNEKFIFRGKLTEVRCYSLEGDSSKKISSGEDISEKFKNMPPFDYTNE